MKTLFILVASLAGCATWQPMDCSEFKPDVTIHWSVVADPTKYCATWKEGGCGSVGLIIMEDPAAADEKILGHEVKHAFGCKHKGT